MYRKPVPLPKSRHDFDDVLFDKVTVNGVHRWIWRTPGSHGILVPRDSDKVVETPEGRGMVTVPLPGFTVGVLNLNGEFGSDVNGKMFRYTLAEGWTDVP
jgi:hypothetical protein